MKGKRKIAMLLTVTMLMTLLTGLFSVGSITVSAVYPDPNGKYVTVAGAGLKDGTSWENAYAKSSLQTAWNATPANGTLYMGSGAYGNVTISLSSGGQDAANPKKLIGVDTGTGKPVVHGPFTATNLKSSTFIGISSGISNIVIENIRIENYYYGIKTGGNQSNITINNVDVYVTNDGIYLYGGGTESNSLKISNVTVQNSNMYYYTKSGIRMDCRVEDVLVSNCLTDAGGQAYWVVGNWPEGFRQMCETSTLAERRITYVDCTSLNNYWEGAADDYWNADGFQTESGSFDINWIRCKSYGSTDGGWDTKGYNVTFTDCIGMDNKKNYRIWGTATMTNCLSAYGFKRGGGYGTDGLWTEGVVTANYCTFYNNQSDQVCTENGGTITLNDCIVGTNKFNQTLYAGSGITKNRTLDYDIKNCLVDPRIKAYDNSYFYGDDDRYNSIYGNTKGYYCNTTNVYVTPTPVPPTPTPVPSAGVTNILIEKFDNYSDVADVSAGGWTLVSPTPTTVANPALAATEAPENYKYLRTNASTSASRTFTPVALKAAGGSSPGKNAKLVVSYDAYTSGGTGSSTAFWKVQDSATGYNAVSAGKRPGSGSYIRYAKTIGSPYTGLTIANSISRFARFKFVIKITDTTGAFLSTGPKVDVYCNDMTTPVLSDVNMIDTATTKVDKFYMGSAFTMEVDNLSITVESDSSDKGALISKLAEANTLYLTASVNQGTRGGQYDPSKVADLSSAITSAQSVFNDLGASQTVVDAAVASLQIAINNCTPYPIDKSALASKLTEANTLYSIASTNIGTSGGQYEQEDVTTLSNAITSAQAIYDNSSSTQDSVDAAVTSLQTAINNCVPIPIDKSALSAKLTEANALYAVASSNIGTRGGQYEQADVTALSDVIASAQSVYNDLGAVQATVDASVVSLQAAIDGCTPIPVDKNALAAKLTEANTLYTTANGNVGDGEGQYDAAVVAALGSAIISAQNIYDTATMQDDIDAAVVSLQNAMVPCTPHTATPSSTPIVVSIYNDDFNGYTDLASMQTAGWALVTPAPTATAVPVLVSTAVPSIVQYFRTVASTSGSITFTPVALTAAGGSSVGKNEKLTITYDAYTWGGSGSSSGFWKFYDSVSGNAAVAAGRRAGQGNQIRYAKSIPSDSTALVISAGLSRFTKMKFVVKITDSAGAFLTGGPKVDIYVGDMVTPVASDQNMIDTATTRIDKFYIGGSITMEVDNLNITLDADA